MTTDLEHPTKAPMLVSVVKARDLIRKGWIKNVDSTKRGEYCFVGALGAAQFNSPTSGYRAAALGGIKRELWNDRDNEIWDFFYDIYLMMGFPHDQTERNPIKVLMDFNDHSQTQKQDILNALDMVIGYLS